MLNLVGNVNAYLRRNSFKDYNRKKERERKKKKKKREEMKHMSTIISREK